MSAQENALATTTPVRLLEDDITIGKEIDSYLSMVGVGNLLHGDKLAITIVGQTGDEIENHCIKIMRDQNGDPEIMALSTNFTDDQPTEGGIAMFDRLAGGIWDWPVTEESEDGK